MTVTYVRIYINHAYLLQVNTFQCVLATNEFESFTMFMYNGLLVINLVGEMGLVEVNSAVVGISAGDGNNYVTLPESGSPCILNIDKTSNVGILAVWMIKVGTGK